MHAGYGMSRMLGSYAEGFDNGSFDFDPSGFIGGAQAGYNWQSGALVYGLEIDGSWSGMDDDRLDADGFTTDLDTNVLASFRGRVGVAAGEQLFYITGGVGYVRSKMTELSSGAPSPASASITDVAPVIGSGVEWAFAPNWNVRLEGLTYLVNERKDLPTLTSISPPTDFLRQSTVKVLRFRLKYRS